MKLAIVGKGGSGKSSVSWLLTKYFQSRNQNVLAIDADYNMDLGHNLGWNESIEIPYFSHSEVDFYQYQELDQSVYYVDMPAREDMKYFSYRPNDPVTEKYIYPIEKGVDLMVAGPVHTDRLYGHRCTHAYMSSLKMYLPLLKKRKEDIVIIDSVAGTDMVSYGMYLGVDAMVVVVEETPNSMGVYRQIKEIADEFMIPVYVVVNKYYQLGKLEHHISPDVILGKIGIDMGLIQYDYTTLTPETLSSVETIVHRLDSYNWDESLQWKRHKIWKERYDTQLEESKKEEYTFVNE